MYINEKGHMNDLKPNKNSDEVNFSEIKKNFDYLLKNELRYGIIVTLRLFSTLKLKKISALLGKTESTIIHHLKLLERKGYIERDEVKRRERGKFYKLSRKTDIILENIFQEFEKDDFEGEIRQFKQMTREKYSQRIIKGIKEQFSEKDFDPLQVIQAGAVINSNITRIIYQDLRNVINTELNGKSEDKRRDIFLANLAMSMFSIPVETPHQVARISELTADYLKKLKNLEKGIIEEKKQKVSIKHEGTNQYVFVFLGPLTGSLSSEHIEIVPI